MELLTLLALAVALGTDAFSMAIGIGINGIRYRQIVLVAGVVCLFHIFMPLAGLVAGQWLGTLLGRLATVLGAGVLLFIGFQMIKESLAPKVVSFTAGRTPLKGTMVGYNPGFWGLMAMAGSVSMDALSVGFTLGTLQAQLALTVLTIGAVAGIMTASGLLFGRRLGTRFEEKAGFFGGGILMAIGIKLLIF